MLTDIICEKGGKKGKILFVSSQLKLIMIKSSRSLFCLGLFNSQEKNSKTPNFLSFLRKSLTNEPFIIPLQCDYFFQGTFHLI